MNSIILKFPPNAKIAVIGHKIVTDETTGRKSKMGPHWRRDKAGAIIATYERGVPMFDDWTFDELEVCMKILEASERCFLSRQKGNSVEAEALARFGARSGDGW